MVAAKRVFSSKGFGKTTMEDIAKEAELSPGTLYLYFKNKDELFSSLSLRVLQYLNIRLSQAVDMAEDLNAEQKIEKLKEAMYDVYKFDPMMLINMFHLQSSETLRNLSEDLLADIKELSRTSLKTTAGLFEDGVREGVFVDIHPAAVADIIWSLFMGIVLWEESKKVIDDRKDYLEDTLDIAFGVLATGVAKR